MQVSSEHALYRPTLGVAPVTMPEAEARTFTFEAEVGGFTFDLFRISELTRKQPFRHGDDKSQ